jgi:serine/threonine protein phosphatase PrpC
MQWVAAGHSVVGGREGNQDSMLVDVEHGSFAVADGIGGGYRGEVASAIGIAEVRLLPKAEPLVRAFHRAQKRVVEDAMEHLGQALMGSTLTALRLENGQAELCHVGDSRCFRYEPPLLHLLTVDHEFFDEASGGPVLSSYLGLDPALGPITIHEDRFPIVGHAAFLLCSDGLYKQLPEARIVELIEQHQAAGSDGALPPLANVEALVEQLVTEASQVQYSDNVTAVFVAVRR